MRVTSDTVCNDAFEVTQELSKRIVELEKDLSKFEAKSIAFEIALQHKSRENNSLKTLQKENENFMASLQIKNAHLKQTYKDLFDSIKKSRVQKKLQIKIEFFKKNQFDSFSSSNVDCNISELKKESNKTSVFQIKIDELEKSLAKQIKENSDLVIKIDNLENVFVDEEKRATLGKLNAFDNENCDFESKVIHLKKIIAQKSKDFDGVNLELSNKTTFFPQKGFKTRASNANNQSFETSHSFFTPVKQVWSPVKESQTFEASSSQKMATS
ncbi:hypothetical protein Tco_1012693 [Tanacetum coccineum]